MTKIQWAQPPKRTSTWIRRGFHVESEIFRGRGFIHLVSTTFPPWFYLRNMSITRSTWSIHMLNPYKNLSRVCFYGCVEITWIRRVSIHRTGYEKFLHRGLLWVPFGICSDQKKSKSSTEAFSEKRVFEVWSKLKNTLSPSPDDEWALKIVVQIDYLEMISMLWNVFLTWFLIVYILWLDLAVWAMVWPPRR